MILDHLRFCRHFFHMIGKGKWSEDFKSGLRMQAPCPGWLCGRQKRKHQKQQYAHAEYVICPEINLLTHSLRFMLQGGGKQIRYSLIVFLGFSLLMLACKPESSTVSEEKAAYLADYESPSISLGIYRYYWTNPD